MVRISNTAEVIEGCTVLTGKEMFPKDEGATPELHPKLLAIVDKVKADHGELWITSTRRSVAGNAAAGGASNSQHLFGRACDLRPADKKAFEALINDLKHEGPYFRELFAMGLRGCGFYGNWVHLDVRPQASMSWWDESKATWAELFASWTEGQGDDKTAAAKDKLKRDGTGGPLLALVLLGLGLIWK